MAAWSFCFFLGGGENLGQNKIWGVYIYIFLCDNIYGQQFSMMSFFSPQGPKKHTVRTQPFGTMRHPQNVYLKVGLLGLFVKQTGSRRLSKSK